MYLADNALYLTISYNTRMRTALVLGGVILGAHGDHPLLCAGEGHQSILEKRDITVKADLQGM